MRYLLAILLLSFPALAGPELTGFVGTRSLPNGDLVIMFKLDDLTAANDLAANVMPPELATVDTPAGTPLGLLRPDGSRTDVDEVTLTAQELRRSGPAIEALIVSRMRRIGVTTPFRVHTLCPPGPPGQTTCDLVFGKEPEDGQWPSQQTVDDTPGNSPRGDQ